MKRSRPNHTQLPNLNESRKTVIVKYDSRDILKVYLYNPTTKECKVVNCTAVKQRD